MNKSTISQNVITFPGRQAMRATAWDELLDMTREMMTRAEANEWPEALEVQRRRRERIVAYFEHGKPSESREEIIAGIQSLLRLDGLLTDMLLQRRTQWQQELAQLHKLNRGAQAYLQSSA